MGWESACKVELMQRASVLLLFWNRYMSVYSPLMHMRKTFLHIWGVASFHTQAPNLISLSCLGCQ